MNAGPANTPPVRDYLVCCPIPGGVDYVRVKGTKHVVDGYLSIIDDKGQEVALFHTFISVVITDIAGKGTEEPPKE